MDCFILQMQQNSLELAAAIKELEESTAALNYNYDTESQASQSSLQCSSGYGTMNSTPASSEDTIASGGRLHRFRYTKFFGIKLSIISYL